MRKAELVTVDAPRMVAATPRAHQMEAIRRFSHEDEIALFFEMGCGKSLTLLRIAEEKWWRGEIEGLLVIAPNDVHRQWYDELVNGIGDRLPNLKDGGKYGLMELVVPFQAQCFGGRGGADEIYPFDETMEPREPPQIMTRDVYNEWKNAPYLQHKYFWFLSVNVDTFSTPAKWKPVVEWANSHKIMIAIDEATVIKNPKSKRTQRLLYEFNRTTRSRGRVIVTEKINPWRAVLTGTPVTNGPVDLWTIMEFLRPGYFRMNYWAFRDYFAMFTQVYVRDASRGFQEREVSVMLTEKAWKGIKECSMYDEARRKFGCSEDTWRVVQKQAEFSGPYKHADELKERIAPVASFKLLAECEDMPPTNYIIRNVGMNEEQQRLYKQATREMSAEYGGAYTDARNILALYVRLQQISSGFIVNTEAPVDVERWEDESYDLEPGEVVWIGKSTPKMEALLNDIDECVKPVIVMTRYTAEAAKIYELCRDKYKTGLFTGWKVDGGVDALKAGELDVLVANSQKICRGFNLQAAHVTLFYSNSFSMETRQQAEYRTFRMGQKHPCLYVDYIASQVEQKIMESLKMKKNLLDYIRRDDMDSVIRELA